MSWIYIRSIEAVFQTKTNSLPNSLANLDSNVKNFHSSLVHPRASNRSRINIVIVLGMRQQFMVRWTISSVARDLDKWLLVH